MKNLIPNIFTLSNALFGVLAIIATINGFYTLAALLILLAAVADVLDGRIARFFNVSDDMGKELDSLCDAISFGAAPAILVYFKCLKSLNWLGAVIAAVFVLCGIWRLARFNITENSIKGYFQGVPTPIAGIAIVSYALSDLSLPIWINVIYVLLVGILMVSILKLPDFKRENNCFRKLLWIPSSLLALIILISFSFSVYLVLFSITICYICFGFINFLAN